MSVELVGSGSDSYGCMFMLILVLISLNMVVECLSFCMIVVFM